MGRRKGELTTAQVDRDYPHQVALRSDKVAGRNHEVVHGFCRDLSVAPRRGYFRHDDLDYVVFCFREEHDAARFCAKFDGQRVEPRRRAKVSRSYAQDWKSAR
jgi:hypothetical protein